MLSCRFVRRTYEWHRLAYPIARNIWHAKQSREASSLTASFKKTGKAALGTSAVTHITTLSNGIRVATENTLGHFSAVGVFVDAGSRYETPRTLGVSHILDRMAFKSTKNRTSAQLQNELEALCGNVMSTTGPESMIYQAAIFPKRLPKIMEFFADVIINPLILPEELEEQQQTALYEINEIWQKPDMILPELTHTVAYNNNTLGFLMICSEERLSAMKPTIIREYLERWYRPERIVIAGAGIEHEETVKLAEKYFGAMHKSVGPTHRTVGDSLLETIAGVKPAGKPSLYKTITTAATSILQSDSSSSSLSPAHEKAHYTGGTLLLDEPTLPFTHMYVAFEGLSVHDPDIYILAALQTLLGGGGSFSAGGPGKGLHTRLFKRVLSQYQWVESCLCFNHCYTDSGLFGIMMSYRPEYNYLAPTVIAEQFNAVASLGNGCVTEDDLMRAKNQLKSNLLMSFESRMVQLEDIGRQVQVNGYRIPVEEMCEKIDQINLEDLVRVAQRVFRGNVYNEGNGTGAITIVAQGMLTGLPNVEKLFEASGLGRSRSRFI
ncbi:1005_t:CDS:2 [Paraglomus occultum]|uniref:Alpha-MPP n=1 Tax=Paraglomus occultum TaxID=144539 RepID=A0A9N8VKH5_9GLOM|nr:1005_t:CDS:2 [Paraglomus occultum]